MKKSLDIIDRALINVLQHGIPLCDTPYAEIGNTVGTSEHDVMSRIERLLHDGVLTRFGPLYNADRMGGANVLAAMCVPMEDFDIVAAQVNAHPEIAHNYQRTHVLNMWFVAAAATPEQVEAVFQAIEKETSLQVHRFPKKHEFFVDLRLPI